MALIISDIAGEFDALMRLVARFPNEDYILVGDLMDRGPDSKEVVEWAMNNPRVTALMGNHEHMMLDYYYGIGRYQAGLWFHNGGGPTHRSFDYSPHPDTLKWLHTRPLYKMLDGCLITHAPLDKDRSLADLEGVKNLAPDFDLSLIWNREEPIRRSYFQIFGHNSHWGLREFSDADGVYAVCIDQSQKQRLTGILWPSLEGYTEPYEELAPKSQSDVLPMGEG